MGLQLVWATWAIICLNTLSQTKGESLSLEGLEYIVWCGTYIA